MQQCVGEVVPQGISFEEIIINGESNGGERPVVFCPQRLGAAGKIKKSPFKKLRDKSKVFDIGTAYNDVFFIKQKIMTQGHAVKRDDGRAERQRRHKRVASNRRGKPIHAALTGWVSKAARALSHSFLKRRCSFTWTSNPLWFSRT